MSTPAVIAVDFETFYTNEYSLSKMSVHEYVNDPRFDAYLVSVFGEGVKFVGPPSRFDWHALDGKVVCYHNASFDEQVVARLQQLGVIPADIRPERVVCTADLAAWLGCRRALDKAALYLLGKEVPKAVRASLKGLSWASIVGSGREDEVCAYAMRDAETCYELASKYLSSWPVEEQRVSELNRKAGNTGVTVDCALLLSSQRLLEDSLQAAEDALPWVADGEKPLSPKAIRLQGRRDGIPVPASLAKDDPAVLEWQKAYGPTHPWIMAAQEYRGINGQLKRVTAIRRNLRPDGTMPYSIKYFGATTGRFSAGDDDSGGKFNMQNMPRDALYNVDIRSLFTAAPGRVFVIPDYRQIEARVLLWLVKDTDFIEAIEREGNMYIAYAKRAWNRSVQKGTKDYQLAKAQCLGLQYYCGAERFRALASRPPYNMDMSPDEALRAVQQYRSANPRIVKFWQEQQFWLLLSVQQKDPTHQVELASGRVLTYFEPQLRGRDVYARYAMGDPLMKLHSGILTNNVVQGTARDILRDAWIKLADSGVQVRWTVHDEAICEVPEDGVEASVDKIKRIMRTSSPWAEGCPIDVGCVVSKRYCNK